MIPDARMNPRRKAVLHSLYRLGTKVPKTVLAADVGISPCVLQAELSRLDLGDYIELNPLRLTYTGLEVVKGYSDG